jgi:hypothetical protein
VIRIRTGETNESAVWLKSLHWDAFLK